MPTGCIMAATVCAALAPGSLNDIDKTPGDVLTTSVVKICNQKTSNVRHVTISTKKASFKLYGVTQTSGWCASKGCEIDHLVSLELGGSNSLKNLWPQPYAGEWNAHLKDALENKLHVLICKKKLSPASAQYQISHDWISAYKKYIEVPADTAGE